MPATTCSRAMANSSGLNERPSRTSLRGVTSLYQGSIARSLRPLESVEEIKCRPLESDQVGIGDGLVVLLDRVQAIPKPVRHENIPPNVQFFGVPLGLAECPLGSHARILGLNDQPTVLRLARHLRKQRHVHIPPLHSDLLRQPAERPKQGR